MQRHQDGRLGHMWTFIFLLTGGAVAQNVNYSPDVCAVEGSEVTLPCSFTPLRRLSWGGQNVKIIRVVWCQNHLICHKTTPSVYDSESKENVPRYQYLGDKTGNCTLQIRDVQKKKDNTSFRFRMEANLAGAHFTGQSGVRVRVVERTELRVNSSSDVAVMSVGGNVTLRCTSPCSFHQLKVRWFRDGHALSETGPALWLDPLTARDSGNYWCALDARSRSPPYQLPLEVIPGGSLELVVSVVLGFLLALCILFLLVFIIRRKLMAVDRDKTKVEAAVEREPNPLSESRCLQQDVNYDTVHFTYRKQAGRVEETEDAVIYSSVTVATGQIMSRSCD